MVSVYIFNLLKLYFCTNSRFSIDSRVNSKEKRELEKIRMKMKFSIKTNV